MTSHSVNNKCSNPEQGNHEQHHEQGNHEQHNVCPPQHVNNPPPSPPPDHSPPPNNCTPCGNGGYASNEGGDAHDAHQAALVSADVTAAVGTSLGIGGGVLPCDLLDVGAHVGVHVGLDVGADIFHV
jgi:hypothetical protein